MQAMMNKREVFSFIASIFGERASALARTPWDWIYRGDPPITRSLQIVVPLTALIR
jgi:hypothetical protein